jgi:hypothetical protein
MRVLLPVAATRGEPVPIAPRARSLERQIWGFVDTSKVNADFFIENLKAEIAKKYQPEGFVVVRKEAPGLALTAEQSDRLEKCGLVIFCFGD